MSADTGTCTARTIRATAANISSGGVEPSSYPREAATPALGVARAGKPASANTRALEGSHGPGRTSGSPDERFWWRLRKSVIAGRSVAAGGGGRRVVAGDHPGGDGE